jgi:chemotaxis protein methyltransferase CheR
VAALNGPALPQASVPDPGALAIADPVSDAAAPQGVPAISAMPAVASGAPARAGASDDSVETLEIELLLEAIVQRFGYDFRDYARGPLRRRLHALMASLDLLTVSRLQERVLRDSAAASALLHQLGQRDSRLFDSPAAYAQLRGAIDLALCGTPLPQVWLADCAGLAEAWSTAILLQEAGMASRAEIFATVPCDDVLAALQTGTIPASEVEASRPYYLNSGGCARLDDYFERRGEHAVLAEPLRSRITWAQHSLVTDASFNEFQLIVCRHALADFNPRLRRRALRLFNDSLARFGVLGLDRPIDAETGLAGLYQPLQPGVFWYRRLG